MFNADETIQNEGQWKNCTLTIQKEQKNKIDNWGEADFYTGEKY
jgi:hypothetical protein